MAHYYDKYSRSELVNIIEIRQGWVEKEPSDWNVKMLEEAKNCLIQFDNGKAVTKFDL